MKQLANKSLTCQQCSNKYSCVKTQIQFVTNITASFWLSQGNLSNEQVSDPLFMTCNSSCLKTSEEREREWTKKAKIQMAEFLPVGKAGVWPTASLTSLLPGETPEHFSQRTELFDKLVAFFPENMTQPKGNLIDMIPIDGWQWGRHPTSFVCAVILPLPSSWVWAPLSDVAVWWTTLQFVSQCEKCKCSWRHCVEMSDNSGLLKQLMSY